MWHEARSNEKKIKELMVDHKKRAERRRAYYESRRGDPRQLLRVVGSAILLHPDAEQYYHHENTNNLMPWQGDPDIKIDRFDGRSLLEFVPDAKARDAKLQPTEDKELSDDLNFERYHDLVEAERLKVSEHDRLAEVEEEWNQLLDRHKALLAMLTEKKSDKPQGFGYDYGTNTTSDDMIIDQGPQLLKDILFFACVRACLFLQTDILKYVDELNDRDRQTLNDMAKKYGIRSYARLLRVAKKDRDDELRDLRSDSETSAEEDMSAPSDVVIEFGSETTPSNINMPAIASSRRTTEPTYHTNPEKTRVSEPANTRPEEKKLTPMEKLKLKMRAGLEKQIQLDQRDERRKRLEKEMEDYQAFTTYNGPMGPIVSQTNQPNLLSHHPVHKDIAPPAHHGHGHGPVRVRVHQQPRPIVSPQLNPWLLTLLIAATAADQIADQLPRKTATAVVVTIAVGPPSVVQKTVKDAVLQVILPPEQSALDADQLVQQTPIDHEAETGDLTDQGRQKNTAMSMVHDIEKLCMPSIQL
ncbi:hypothetical protein PHYBLDRAFT_185225 [Phycomyces blakesleeanus NRRL 1555(-)]|uniref:Suppressor of white apricot N-terminal domain-containing protein n=1 Tax=Phycomyces blakesleeanus (strain ATCC 8743b / DSM 1359 / FGSC 10004 / NBRC 33097 / NRRL 1555) TaxID=763407 RepID=A0A163B684_PHYB8|nr:hypothetical protein PHYBLDRAFT_185225 [Phycomyces blakesleeanus NRRL 1555(-)]OAD78501.1 hypothetical protein PHYBLDRAFT_185225 [Phycomyces blakesleeanus NRRL 1555(-)]|eukprot:XP_018296541.1 hypothetical protein PHYBLDRAFT_185225 [Phycomyces blakesleeanus NRRL 1555(-)]